MYLNATAGTAASKNYTGVFYTELENNPAPSWIQLVFWIILSSVRTEIIAFTKGFPQMREWLGERRIKSLSEYSIEISKKDHELTVGVSRDDIFFDRFNIIAGQIRGIAQAVPRHFVKFFVDLCLGGFATTSYDGANYFDTAHPNGATAPTTWSNKTSNTLDAASYAAAKTSAAKIKNSDSDTYMSVRYTHLFYAANAEVDVQQLYGVQTLANGASNINYNSIPAENRILVQEFGDRRFWFLFDLAKILRPFVLQIVKGVDFVPFDSPNDWIVFIKKEYVYGIDTMDNATYLLPELAFGSNCPN